MAAFTSVFGVSSLTSTFRGFFIESWQLMTVGQARGNLVTYFVEIQSLRNLPILIALFVLAGAYRDRYASGAFGMAAAFLGVITLLYAFTNRGGTAILNYVHAPTVFASLGIALYLSGVAGLRDRNAAGLSFRREPLWGTILIGCLFAGIAIAANIPDDVRIDYFFESGVRFPLDRRLAPFFTLGPIALVALLALSEAARWRWAAIAFACYAVAWGPAYPAGLALVSGRFAAAEGNAYFGAARILEKVPADRFIVVVERWSNEERWKHLDGWRVLWTFHIFYGERYGRGTGAEAKTRHQNAVLANIAWPPTPKLPAGLAPGTIVLTDSLAALHSSGYRFHTVTSIASSDLTFHVVAIEG
jgi:hypothetical protein